MSNSSSTTTISNKNISFKIDNNKNNNNNNLLDETKISSSNFESNKQQDIENNASLNNNNNNNNTKLNDTDNVELKNHDHLDNNDHDLNINKTNKINLNKKQANQQREFDFTKLTEEDFVVESSISSNLEADVLSLLENSETVTKYKLRAEAVNKTNCDWIKAPSYFDEQQISELTYDQIKFTLDYFIESGYRVSQMTKTYYDIEAVTKLLDEKEKDLELAATIGKQLLEKDQQLEEKIEFLEIQLEKTTEMVNQLRHDINLKDDLLKLFLDSETDSLSDQIGENSKKIEIESGEKISDYKKKINFLEDENELLRNKAEYFEKETIDLETKESVIIENCFKELEMSQMNLNSTQEELRVKKNECINQQEEIQNLFSQIFDLQKKVRSLTKDNQELQSVYQSSSLELTEQINELKEKYNECLKVLSKTQEELSSLRKKHASKQKSLAASNLSANTQQMINIECCSIDFDEDEINSNNNCPSNDSNLLNIRNNRLKNSLTGPNLASLRTPVLSSPYINSSNSNSLAAELFSTLAKDYRNSNSTLAQQASQSSDFIKKVKQKLTKQIPGSNLESCLQSDSEIEFMLNSSGISSTELENAILQHQQLASNSFINQTANNLKQNAHSTHNFSKFTNCPTPDSVLSTGSASIYSNLIARSSSFLLPEKLQIVKPIEGSQTLQHWQNLARPNMGCLFESRPGISIKGNNLENEIKSKRKCSIQNDYLLNEEKLGKKIDFENDLFEEEEEDDDDDDQDDGVNLEMFDDEDLEYEMNNSSNFYGEFENRRSDFFNERMEYSKNVQRGVLSPSRVELLSKLLENEENRQKSQKNADAETSSESAKLLKSNTIENELSAKQNNFFFDIFRNFSTKYFKSNSSFEINNNKNFKEETNMYASSSTKKKRKRHDEFDDPDTPPSSPINIPDEQKENNSIKPNSSNILLEAFESAKIKCRSAFTQPFSNYFHQPATAPTPPGTPTVELDEEYMNSEEYKTKFLSIRESSSQPVSNTTQSKNFFDQIVSKLSLFSFNSVTNIPPSQQNLHPFIIKPQPVYANNNNNLVQSSNDEFFTVKSQNEPDTPNINHSYESKSKETKYEHIFIEEEEEHDNELNDIIDSKICNKSNKNCETPPPSPSKFSPPLPELEDDFNEEDFKKSAFVRVASLNPYINKSVDLASLLGSLSSLKRNQRLCKYY